MKTKRYGMIRTWWKSFKSDRSFGRATRMVRSGYRWPEPGIWVIVEKEKGTSR